MTTSRSTHTHAILSVDRKVYDAVFKALKEAGYEHAIDGETGVIDMTGLALDTEAKQFETVDWRELSRRGLVERINREITHPVGLAVFYDPETGVSAGALVAPDGVWQYPEDDIREDKGVKLVATPRTSDELVAAIFAMLPGGADGYLKQWGTCQFSQMAARINALIAQDTSTIVPDISRVR